MKKTFLITALFTLLLSGCQNSSTTEKTLPSDATGSTDETTGVGLYYVSGNGADFFNQEYVMDQGKVLAVLNVQGSGEYLELGPVHDNEIILFRGNDNYGTRWNDAKYYAINRQDGSIYAGDTYADNYWLTTPDQKAILVYSNTSPDPYSISVVLDALSFNTTQDSIETYALPDSTKDSGWFLPSAFSISTDGTKIAFTAQDQIREQNDTSQYYGALFVIDRTTQTISKITDLTEPIQEGPYLPFNDGQFTWDTDNTVTYTIGDHTT